MRRIHRPARSTVAAAAVVVVFVLAASILAVGVFIQGEFRPTGSALGMPSVIPLCGRHFAHPETDVRTWTRAEVDAAIRPGDDAVILEPTIGRIPLVDALVPRSRTRGTQTCAAAIWLHVGPDQYVSYALEGGP